MFDRENYSINVPPTIHNTNPTRDAESFELTLQYLSKVLKILCYNTGFVHPRSYSIFVVSGFTHAGEPSFALIIN